jgi:hypothetical protein
MDGERGSEILKQPGSHKDSADDTIMAWRDPFVFAGD